MPISRIGTDGIENGAVAPADLSTGGPYWDGSSNFGVGTTSPNSFANYKAITINGSSGGILSLNKNGTEVGRISGDDNFSFFAQSTQPITFGNSGGERMRVDAIGNFGLQAVPPTSTSGSYLWNRGGCTISDGLGAAYYVGVQNAVFNSGWKYVANGFATSYVQDGNHIWYTAPSGTAGNALTFSEIGRFDNAGRFMVGTNTSTFNLRISGDAHFGDAYDASKYGFVQITRPSNQGTIWHLSFIRSGQQVAGIGFANNSSTFVVANAGSNAGSGMTLAVNGTSWGTQSDERKKNILGYVEDGLNKVTTLRPVFFEYKSDELKKRRVGLIAQDVQAVLPEAIDVQDDEDQTLNLQYSDLIPLLIKSIQELKAELDATKAEVAALKGAV